MNIETINIHSLPSLKVSERKNLPESSGLYFVISCEEIIYLGASINIKQRWLSHHKLKTIMDFDSIKIAWLLLEKDNLSECEKNAIDCFRPKLNSAERRYPYSTKNQGLDISLGMISSVIKIKLEEQLAEKKKTLYQLQKETGVAYNALSKIKKNQVKGITWDVLEKICDSLECEPADLIAIEK